MSTNEVRSQDGIAIIAAGDDAKITDDIPNWEGPFTEYNRYGEPTRHNYVRCLVCGAEALDGETSTASHRPAYRYEQSAFRVRARLKMF